MTSFAVLGEQIDDWLHRRRLQWLRLRRRLPGYKAPPPSPYATLWNSDLLSKLDVKALDRLVDRPFDFKPGRVIHISTNKYGNL